MRYLLYHILLLFCYLPVYTYGQGMQIAGFSPYEYLAFKNISPEKSDFLDILLAASPSMNASKFDKFRKRLNNFTEQFRKMQHKKSGVVLIRKIYCQIYRTFLKNYCQYATLSEAFEQGDYDCLSGTILFTYVLKGLGYRVRAIETNYHVYLKVVLSSREILIETTDPFHGFIIGKKAISRREKIYLSNNTAPAETNVFQTSLNIQKKVNLRQLTGLQYYNKSVEYFNAGKPARAILYLEKSAYLYNSEKQKELREKLMIRQVFFTTKAY